jgi:prolyl-tRNA synthetase
LYDYVNGNKVKVGQGPRLQVKEAFGIGMIMKLGPKKKAK